MNKYECLKLDNQMCFPLYVCAKEVVKRYKPFLDEIDCGDLYKEKDERERIVIFALA